MVVIRVGGSLGKHRARVAIVHQPVRVGSRAFVLAELGEVRKNIVVESFEVDVE